jgi:hypothetical protein
MNLKLEQFNFDQFLDRCFIVLIVAVFACMLISLASFAWLP